MDIPAERYQTVPLFEDLEPSEIMRFLKSTEDLTARPGDVIVREGEAGDGFYIIGNGTFEVRKEGLDTVLARLEELSFFGEMSLVTNDTRSATVQCAAEGRLKRVSKARFEELLGAGDIVAYKIIRNMARILAVRLARIENRFVSEMARMSLGV